MRELFQFKAPSWTQRPAGAQSHQPGLVTSCYYPQTPKKQTDVSPTASAFPCMSEVCSQVTPVTPVPGSSDLKHLLPPGILFCHRPLFLALSDKPSTPVHLPAVVHMASFTEICFYPPCSLSSAWLLGTTPVPLSLSESHVSQDRLVI